MVIHDIPVDHEFSFASGLHSLLSKQFGCDGLSIAELCGELTEGYSWEVEIIGSVKGEVGIIYFKVGEKLSEVVLGWVHGIISYHTPAGVKAVLIQSGESCELLLEYLQMQYDLEKDLHKLLTKQGGQKIAWDDKGCTLIKDTIAKRLSGLDCERRYDLDVMSCGRKVRIRYNYQPPERHVTITGAF